MTDNQIKVSGVDEPHPDLPPPVNDLVVTVLAPSAALSGADGQIRATGVDGLQQARKEPADLVITSTCPSNSTQSPGCGR